MGTGFRKMVFVGAVLAGCSAIPELTFVEVDGGVDGGPCVSTGKEICDDGIDNDCDGKIDCADSECGAFICVDPAPPDWAIVAFSDANSLRACPDGFGGARDVRSAIAGAASCPCNCSGSPTCANGNIGFAFGGPTCAGADSPQTLDVAASCKKLAGNGVAIAASTTAKLTPPAGPSTCNAPAPAPAPLKDARVCALGARVGGGCPNGQVCVPRVRESFDVCIDKPGENACPPSYPVVRRAGDTASDTRGCGACTCTKAPCTAEVKLFDSVGCGGPETLKVSTTSCDPNTNAGFQARAYTSTVGGGCIVGTPSMPTGALTLTGEITVCCK